MRRDFATATVEVQGPRPVVIEVTDVGTAPERFAGTLEALLHWAGEAHVRVEHATLSAPAARFTVSWGAA